MPGPRSEVRITLDPSKPKIAYAVVDGRIYRTENSGDSWKSISSGALAVLSWDRLNSTHLCWQVVVDQKKPAHLLVGIRNDGVLRHVPDTGTPQTRFEVAPAEIPEPLAMTPGQVPWSRLWSIDLISGSSWLVRPWQD